jgi:tetratricopeptide (TPR) repeat protein
MTRGGQGVQKFSPVLVLTFAVILPALPAEAQRPDGIASAGMASEQLMSARQLQQAGQYSAARAVLLQALSTAPDSAPLLDALGSVEQDMGQYGEAERLYLRALAASTGIDGDGERIVVLNNLGTLYLETAQYAKGEWIREQLQKLVPTLFESHPLTAGMLLSVVASLEHARNRDKEAERYYVRSLQLFEQANRTANWEAAIVKNNLGGLKLEAGRCDPASDLFREAIRDMESTSGPESPALVKPLINLARCENLGHRPQVAEPLARRAVELSTRIFGEAHQVTATAMLEQATALRRLGRKEPARNLEKRAKAGLRTSPAINTSGYTVDVNELARERMR